MKNVGNTLMGGCGGKLWTEAGKDEHIYKEQLAC